MGDKRVKWSLAVGMSVLLTGSSLGTAQSVAVERPVTTTLTAVTVDVTDAPLVDVLQSITRQAGLRASWDDKVFMASRVTLHVRQMPVDEVFAKVLVGTGLKANIAAGCVVIMRETTSAAVEGGVIIGKIVDGKTKAPLRGVLVTVDGAKKGVVSNDEGGFRVTAVTAGAHVVHAKILGYTKATTSTTVADGETAAVTLEMTPSVNALEQVVVTGTVVATELKAVPNAITIISGKELEERGITHIDQLFRGDVPGLFVPRTGQQSATSPGQVTVYARGNTLMNSASGGIQGIKTYVDGIELADKQYLGLIDPKSIERIEIVAGPEASTIYGSNAISGVMQIFTKRGSTPRPQFTTTFRGAWTQNNFSSSVAPQYDVGTNVNGVERHLSYNVGASWQYQGSWVPAVKGQSESVYGGGQITIGAFTSDITLRAMQSGNRSNGVSEQGYVERGATGEGTTLLANGAVPSHTAAVNTDNSIGITNSYTVTPWWSHVLTLGVDRLEAMSQTLQKSYRTPGDSIQFMTQHTTQNLTGAYSTTLRVSLTSVANMVMTLGGDESHSTTLQFSGNFKSAGNGSAGQGFFLSRSRANEHGGYLNSVLGLWDAVFVTYGVRAVYNPNIGEDQNPNLQPRYGIAMTHMFGAVTAKLRAAYGHSTRPPTNVLTNAIRMSGGDPSAVPIRLQLYGDTLEQFANPNLLPEQQRGGEGGLELYLGDHASFVVNRFNNMVDNLIYSAIVDSVDALPEQRALHGWRPWLVNFQENEYVNLGKIRNQGWEGISTFTLGPLTTTGTYSWTKSRLVGMNPKYRRQFPWYVVGSALNDVPEHTYGIEIAYVRNRTRIAYNIQGQSAANVYSVRLVDMQDRRLLANASPIMSFPGSYTETQPGYAMGDLNVSYQFASSIEGLLQINNLTNSYHGDIEGDFAQSGRVTGLGVRLRF